MDGVTVSREKLLKLFEPDVRQYPNSGQRVDILIGHRKVDYRPVSEPSVKLPDTFNPPKWCKPDAR